ncbi:MAG: peptide deformylase [Planctomycetota bacterium]
MTVQPENLRIVIHPAEVLRRKAEPVDPAGESAAEVAAVAQRMVDLMRSADGIGLAAPQVGLSWRLFVADVAPAPDSPRPPEGTPADASPGPQVFCNPQITAFEGDPTPFEEGCLSLPGINGEVMRPPVVTLRYQSLDGTWHEASASGLLARCWQHEIDHLDGVLIIDKMDKTGLSRSKAAIRNLEKRAR